MFIERSSGGGTASPSLTVAAGQLGTPGSDDDSDRALVARWRAGDDEALGALFQRHEQAVRRVCASRLRDRELTDEAVQRTFERLLGKRDTFVGGEHLLRYLRRTARFVAIDVLNEQRDQRRTVDVPSDLPDCAPTADIEHVIERRLSATAVLDGLPSSQRELLHAHYFEGRSVGEIAEARQITPASCHTMLTRSRQRAAERARALDIRSLMPVGLLVRLRERLDRTAPTSPQLVAAAATAFVAVAVAGLTAPAPLDGTDPGGVAMTVATGDLTSTPTPPARAPSTAHAAPTTVPERPPVSVDAAPTTDEAAAPKLLPIEDVPIPGTDTTVHQEPPDDPDHTYTVTTGVGPDVGYKSGDEPTDEPIHDAVCGHLTDSPVVTCTTD